MGETGGGDENTQRIRGITTHVTGLYKKNCYSPATCGINTPPDNALYRGYITPSDSPAQHVNQTVLRGLSRYLVGR